MLADLINLNEIPDYSVFLTLFCSYLLVLWLIISVWVGVDARRRFGRNDIALLFFLLTFFLNFPVLLFYFIIRPEEKYNEIGEWETGGVNVPIVNFVGKEGVEMAFQLKIKPAKLAEQNDMKIDVSWDSVNEDMKLQTASGNIELDPSIREKKRPERRVTNIFSSWSGLVKKRIEKFRQVSVDYDQDKVKNDLSLEDRESQKNDSKFEGKEQGVKNPHKTKKKKKKKKNK